MTYFANKVMLITGAGSGIGRATAKLFAKEGCRLFLMDLSQEGLVETAEQIQAQGGQVEYFVSDISKKEDAESGVAQCIERFSDLHFLFNNAGCEFVSPLMDTADEDWRRVVDTNYSGLFYMSRAALKHMTKQKFGVITNNASDAGLRGIRLNAAYSSSKAAIIHLTRSMSLDYASAGVRTNCICPGCIRTPLCERFNAEVGAREGKSGPEVLKEFVEANIPMLRVGEPEEVAEVVLFLCSAKASYINGAIIPIDGGLTAGM